MQGIFSIFDDVLAVDKRNVLRRFQTELGNIPKWNQHIIDDEVRRIVRHADGKSNVKLDDLVTSIFVCNARILSSVSTSVREGRINLKIPKMSVFIHHVYIEVARKMYKNVYLFDTSKSLIVKQKNMHEVEVLVQASVINTLQSLLPMQDIIHNYVTSPESMQTQHESAIAPLAIEAQVPESSIDLSESRQLLEDLKDMTPDDSADSTLQSDQEQGFDDVGKNTQADSYAEEDQSSPNQIDSNNENIPTSENIEPSPVASQQEFVSPEETPEHNDVDAPLFPKADNKSETSEHLSNKRPFELIVDDVSNHDSDDEAKTDNKKHGPQLHLDVIASDVDDYDHDADTSVMIDYGSDSSRTRKNNKSKAGHSPANSNGHESNIDIYMDMSDEEPVRNSDDMEYAYTDDELMSEKEDDISDFIKKLRNTQRHDQAVKTSDSESPAKEKKKMNVFIGDLGSRKISADIPDHDEETQYLYQKKIPKTAAQNLQKDKKTIRIFEDSSDDDTELSTKQKKTRKKPTRKQVAESVDLKRDSSPSKSRKKVQLFPDAISEDELD